MHELTVRQSKLLRLLVERDVFLPVNYYSKILGVSDRTIYNDINSINQALETTKIRIRKKPRSGICLEAAEGIDLERETAEVLLAAPNVARDYQYPLERQIEIARELLIQSEIVSYSALSERFLVSKTSIANDLETIDRIIAGSNAGILADNSGTKIVGEESAVQKAIKQFGYFIIEKAESNGSFKIQFPQLLFAFLPQQVIVQVLNLLQDNRHFNSEDLSDDYFQSLVLSISIFLVRIGKGFHLEDQSQLLLENVESLRTFHLTSELIENLQSSKREILTNHDFDFLNSQLIAHGLEPKLKDSGVRKLYQPLVKKLIERMSHSLEIDLTKDDKLLNSLLYHLVSMIYRMKISMPIKNPVLDEIKQEYSVLYSTTLLVLNCVEEALAIKLTEDEVGFVTIHFQCAIERAGKNHKILVVCPAGIGTSELIVNRLKKVLPTQDLIEVVSLRTLDKRDLRDIDLIISSVTLENVGVPIIYVSPLMIHQDLKKVSGKYLELFHKEDDTLADIKFHHLKYLLDENLIFLQESLDNKKACISKITQELLKRDYVTEAFEASIWERERMGVTDLPTGVAIPHTLPATVLQSKLVIMTLNKSIRWNQRLVNTVLMICIAEKDLKKVKGWLSEIYAIVESKNNIDKILFSQSKEQIIDTLGGNKID